ncbi:unnamed protein product, partial [Ectocarpus sp. 13 AM-2016]
ETADARDVAHGHQCLVRVDGATAERAHTRTTPTPTQTQDAAPGRHVCVGMGMTLHSQIEPASRVTYGVLHASLLSSACAKRPSGGCEHATLFNSRSFSPTDCDGQGGVAH